jgi:hypothetical protein
MQWEVIITNYIVVMLPRKSPSVPVVPNTTLISKKIIIFLYLVHNDLIQSA